MAVELWGRTPDLPQSEGSWDPFLLPSLSHPSGLGHGNPFLVLPCVGCPAGLLAPAPFPCRQWGAEKAALPGETSLRGRRGSPPPELMPNLQAGCVRPGAQGHLGDSSADMAPPQPRRKRS
ncbi:Hypothetical predicted protein [Podarcis lilfordi]|uniref:Uncharacterized protein n=1 Tax=Podarcis lilfordi TaxID=74358 RepID=A0AA35K643_9SAUR|nr:Hypothetical predicted protein [Podarcis lilfordi]